MGTAGGYTAREVTIAVWAEENAAIGGGDEWSFGNGATGPIGLPVPGDGWEVFALGFHADNVAAQVIDLELRERVTGALLLQWTVTGPGNLGNGGDMQQIAPVPVPPNAVIGFRTAAVSGGGVSDARVVAYLRRSV